MKLVLDAPVAASWLLKRIDLSEIAIADRAEESPRQPTAQNSSSIWPRSTSSSNPSTSIAMQRSTINLARSHQLTAYGATYLELALRTGSSLATFDRQLASAFRNLGGHVFGDLP